MQREYYPLPLRELGGGARFHRPTQQEAQRVAPESPALEVMTDLQKVSPAAIRPDAPLSAANRLMITRGVRLLLVVDERLFFVQSSNTTGRELWTSDGTTAGTRVLDLHPSGSSSPTNLVMGDIRCFFLADD